MAWHPSSVLRLAAEDDALFQDEIDGINAAELAAEGNSGQALIGFTPIPVPFVTSQSTASYIPRVPIRMSPSNLIGSSASPLTPSKTGGMGGKTRTPAIGTQPSSSDSDLTATEKLDPRLARFSETVQQILNDLIANGWIYKGTNNRYQINFSPRQITAAQALNGEIFLNTTTNKISFRDNGGAVRPLE